MVCPPISFCLFFFSQFMLQSWSADPYAFPPISWSHASTSGGAIVTLTAAECHGMTWRDNDPTRQQHGMAQQQRNNTCVTTTMHGTMTTTRCNKTCATTTTHSTTKTTWNDNMH